MRHFAFRIYPGRNGRSNGSIRLVRDEPNAVTARVGSEQEGDCQNFVLNEAPESFVRIFVEVEPGFAAALGYFTRADAAGAGRRVKVCRPPIHEFNSKLDSEAEK